MHGVGGVCVLYSPHLVLCSALELIDLINIDVPQVPSCERWMHKEFDSLSEWRSLIKVFGTSLKCTLQ